MQIWLSVLESLTPENDIYSILCVCLCHVYLIILCQAELPFGWAGNVWQIVKSLR